MTPGEFRRIRQKLGIGRDQLGRILGISERSIRFYESEISNKPPGPTVVKVMTWLDDGTLTLASVGVQSD